MGPASRPIPCAAGDFLPITWCDSLTATGETTFEFHIWTHNFSELCRVELRPAPGFEAQAEPIVGWEMPDGWTADWLPNEPGAIAIDGCVQQFGPAMRITLADRAGGLEARFFAREGARVTTWFGSFVCPAGTTPAQPSSWGSVKLLYR
jgi:hypothetical protein